ncbi:hypothetical protein PV341_13755 [Streptomyces sp. PA03-1a]|nr:hypothetical protein [Streptomyces sp. PA03-1a]MDX2814074.1 hypothetical protein [Streptomyces sp. PA03-5A]
MELGRGRVRAWVAAWLLIAPLSVLGTTSPAQAAERCVAPPTEYVAYSEVGAPNYPVTLRGIITRLYTGIQSAGAYGGAYVPDGSYVSIDRSINAFSPTAAEEKAGHGYRTNAQVTANGGYDYCQRYHSGTTGWTPSPTVQGRYHAVRPCLRVYGVLECAPKWYVDFDG